MTLCVNRLVVAISATHSTRITIMYHVVSICCDPVVVGVQVKSSSDHVILYVFQSVLRYLVPEFVRRRLWPLFYSRSTVLISNLPGPDCAVTLAGKQVPAAVSRHAYSDT